MLLADFVLEGRHALDDLAGFPRNKRLMDLRVYCCDWESWRATNLPLQFEALLSVLIVVFMTM
jgi:hypothetical protein